MRSAASRRCTCRSRARCRGRTARTRTSASRWARRWAGASGRTRACARVAHGSGAAASRLGRAAAGESGWQWRAAAGAHPAPARPRPPAGGAADPGARGPVRRAAEQPGGVGGALQGAVRRARRAAPPGADGKGAAGHCAGAGAGGAARRGAARTHAMHVWKRGTSSMRGLPPAPLSPCACIIGACVARHCRRWASCAQRATSWPQRWRACSSARPRCAPTWTRRPNGADVAAQPCGAGRGWMLVPAGGRLARCAQLPICGD